MNGESASKDKEPNGVQIQRTADIEVAEDFTFSKFMLSDKLLKSLSNLNFVKPSPIQLKVIPLARCGLDMIMQAKSGTGKTLAFAICLLENYNPDLKFPQSLVIVPTREIAVQIVGVLKELGRNQKHFKACEFIGGCEIANDRKNIQTTKVIVGTPGRILHLINNQIFNVSNIKTLVLDEADKLLESGQMAKDVKSILNAMQKKIQILAATATVTDHMENILKTTMKNPIGITPKHEVPVLLGIKQFVKILPRENDNIALMNAKINELVKIFSRITFKQCLLFTDSQSKTESYGNYLKKKGWPNEVINGAQEQSQRLEVLEKLVNFKCRVLITTDLMARGIDVENINLIINLDLPYDCFTYLHRIGRAGRFGSHGLAITFVNGEEDLGKIQKILGDIGGENLNAMKFPDESTDYDFWNFDKKQEGSLETIAGFSNFNSTAEEDDTLVNNLALLDIAKKLVDDKSEKKSFDLNAIMKDFEKNSSGIVELIETQGAAASENTLEDNIFLKTIEDLNLYENEIVNKEDERKEVRHVIFKRNEIIEDADSESSESDFDENEETDTSEEFDDDDQHENPPQESDSHPHSFHQTPNHYSTYYQHASSNYSQWENIYHFQLANIQNYIQRIKK